MSRGIQSFKIVDEDGNVIDTVQVVHPRHPDYNCEVEYPDDVFELEQYVRTPKLAETLGKIVEAAAERVADRARRIPKRLRDEDDQILGR